MVSFLPIILMGVLFGLAMDYEVFLVSQMREDYVHGHDAQHAIRTGFTSSARVVTAAAIIMISVFAAFIPDGNATIKPIALGLAVGVFVDAFLVRMTLVPAVMALLGNAAWWIPRWLDRVLPGHRRRGPGPRHATSLRPSGTRRTDRSPYAPSSCSRRRATDRSSSTSDPERRTGHLRAPGPAVPVGPHLDAVGLAPTGRREPRRARPRAARGERVRAEEGTRGAGVQRDEDELTVRQYLCAVSWRSRSSPGSPGEAVDQALRPVGDAGCGTAGRRRARGTPGCGSRTASCDVIIATERQLCWPLSAAAIAAAGASVGDQDADAGIGTVEMSWIRCLPRDVEPTETDRCSRRPADRPATPPTPQPVGTNRSPRSVGRR